MIDETKKVELNVKFGEAPQALKSKAKDQVIAVTAHIYDQECQYRQSDINKFLLKGAGDVVLDNGTSLELMSDDDVAAAINSEWDSL